MLSWYSGRKISNRYLRFLPLEQYYPMIRDLRNDNTIQKTATNLVFLIKANNQTDVDSKILISMFNSQPKRADHYWLLHVDITDNPHTIEYEVKHLIPGILTRVDFYLGFRVERRIYSMFKQVVHDMGKNGEIDLFSGYPSLRRHNILTDFKFIIIDRLHAFDLEFRPIERLFIRLYIILIRISLSDVRAFGFDTSTVHIEKMPLGYDQVMLFNLKRIIE
jgi:KUP system potassium uptake protein